MHERRINREIERLRDPQRVERLEVPRVVDLALADLPGAPSVLDIGSGSGLFAEQFAARGLRVTGIDANPEMLPAAQQSVPRAEFHQGIAEKLPFADGAFDLAFMGLLLHETDDLAAALREAYRVSTRRLAVLEWPYADQDFGPPLAHRLKPADLDAAAQQIGFKPLRSTRLTHLVIYLWDRVE